MPSFNVVRFRVKPGQDEAFLEAHRGGRANWPGLERGVIFRTGEGGYCLVGEWRDEAALADARPHMIATLNTFRGTLEDLGGGRGVTDAVSGPLALDLKA
jgi:quinol monooxygenase YgiN